MAENVGSIYYTVEADTSKLLNSSSSVDSSLDRLNKRFGQTDKAAGAAEFQMKKTASAVRNVWRETDAASASMQNFTRIIAGYLTLQGAGELIRMAEAYNEMAERIRFATSSQEEFEMVQSRLLSTANRTYRSLSETQEIYILTADTLRSMGYSTSQALDITDSLSFAFVKNAASVERAQNATRAYTNAIMKGKLEADGWASIIAAVPTVINDIAVASGKSAEEIRQLGATGALTATMLNEGLRQSLDSNRKAADGMQTTVRDAFTNIRNNLSAFIGEANSSSGATQVLSSALIALGNNIDVVVNGLLTLGAGALAKYIAQTGISAVESARAALAARARAMEELKLAQAEVTATAATAARAQAQAGLTVTYEAATAAAARHEAATIALAAAQRTAAVSGASLIGILGGPVGIVSLVASVAAGMFLFSDNTKKATASLDDMQGSLDSVRSKMEALSEAQRQVLQNTAEQKAAEAVRELDDAFSQLARGSMADGTRASAQWRAANTAAISDLIARAKEGTISFKDFDQSMLDLVNSYAQATGRSKEWVASMTQEVASASASVKAAEDARAKRDQLAQVSRELSNATRDAANATNQFNAALNDAQTDDYLKKLQDRANALRDGNSATKAAQRYLAGLNDISEERRKAILEEAAAVDRLNAAQTSSKETTKQTDKATEERIRAQAKDIEQIDRLAQSLLEAGLAGEQLAVVKARASLSQWATPEQIKQVEDLAAAVERAQAAQKKREEFGTDPAKKILGTVPPLQGGAFDDQFARYEAEAKAEEERYAAQQERLRQAKELEIEIQGGYQALEEQMAKEHADRMTQIEQAKNQTIAASGEKLFGSLADAVKNYAGEANGAYRALFAVSKAFAIANATLNLSSALSQALADPTALTPAQKFANMATVAAAGGQLISAISGASFGGGRQYGGPVSPGNFYRINETGAPEILNTNGRQYLMMNGGRGTVTPMETAGGSGSPVINVSVTINSDGSSQVEASSGYQQFGREIGQYIDGRFNELIARSKQQGGQLWGGGTR